MYLSYPAYPAYPTYRGLGSYLFFWLAPGTVAGLVPYLITGWRFEAPFFGMAATRVFGALILTAATAVVIECFWRFAMRGRGTPAPIAPTEELVASGLYRHVRNPMYVGVLAAVVGQALLFGSGSLLIYAGSMWLIFHTFVLMYEEPALRRQFGASYDQFLANVPRWPRWRLR